MADQSTPSRLLSLLSVENDDWLESVPVFPLEFAGQWSIGAVGRSILLKKQKHQKPGTITNTSKLLDSDMPE